MRVSVCRGLFLSVLVPLLSSLFDVSAAAAIYQMNQRFGVADAFSISGHRLTDFDYAKLGHFGWYSDQEADYTGCPGSVRVNDYWTIKRVPLLAKSGPIGSQIRASGRSATVPAGTAIAVWEQTGTPMT